MRDKFSDVLERIIRLEEMTKRMGYYASEIIRTHENVQQHDEKNNGKVESEACIIKIN